MAQKSQLRLGFEAYGLGDHWGLRVKVIDSRTDDLFFLNRVCWLLCWTMFCFVAPADKEWKWKSSQDASDRLCQRRCRFFLSPNANAAVEVEVAEASVVAVVADIFIYSIEVNSQGFPNANRNSVDSNRTSREEVRIKNSEKPTTVKIVRSRLR